MAMMKTIVGSFILKEDPKSLATTAKGSQRLLRLFYKTKITAMGYQGNNYVASTSSSSNANVDVTQ
jgi:hypothetical protein